MSKRIGFQRSAGRSERAACRSTQTGPATPLPSSSPRVSRPAPGRCFGPAHPERACSTSAPAGSARSSGRSATISCHPPASTSRGVASWNPTGLRCRSRTTARPSPGWRSGLTSIPTLSRRLRRSSATSRSKAWMRATALPPLLRPGLLTDLTGYRAWERAVIDILATPRAPEAALAEISALHRTVRAWTPRDGELREAVVRAGCQRAAVHRRRSVAGRAMGNARRSWPVTTTPFAPRCRRASRRCRHRIGSTQRTPGGWPRPGRSFSQPLRHFLAAHAFGNWCAYHGMGLRTVVRSLEVALCGRCGSEAAAPLRVRRTALDEPLLLADRRRCAPGVATRLLRCGRLAECGPAMRRRRGPPAVWPANRPAPDGRRGCTAERTAASAAGCTPDTAGADVRAPASRQLTRLPPTGPGRHVA